MKRKILIIGAIVSAYVAGLFSQDVKVYAIKNLYKEEYSNLVFLCDHAMREHFISKQLLAKFPNEKHATQNIQAEVALIDCQDYDILRKKLISFGLKEADLSQLSLLSIEEKSKDIRKVVETHEIAYD